MIGPTVKRLRTEKGWTQAQLAVYSGMAVSAVCQIETGKRSPNVGSLYKLAAALGIHVRHLFPD